MAATTLIGADLDGTLIPPEANERQRSEIREFNRLVRDTVGLRLAYVTGRHRTLALDGVRAAGLVSPDYLVCDVGTSVHVRSGDHFRLDRSYRRILLESWGGRTSDDVASILECCPGALAQEEEHQGEFKRSYYVERPSDLDAAERWIEERLSREGVPARVMTSVDVVKNRGLVDVLPPCGAKDSALEHLRRSCGAPAHRVVFAGDSGNDLPALLSGVNAIVVGNAPEELKAEVRRRAAEQGIAERIHFATAQFAAGVIEGCKRFGLFTDAAGKSA
ncbi:MAG: HAD-IIB family hydrolase [Planctomycetes bacterium]|nr:HAD-IIB family hydrolase [Planctomycetota bacterium]